MHGNACISHLCGPRIESWACSNCSRWLRFVDLNLTPRVFLRALRFSSLCKIDSQLIPSGCDAVLVGPAWIVFGAVRQADSTLLRSDLAKLRPLQVYDCEKGGLASQVSLKDIHSGKRLKRDIVFQGRRIGINRLCLATFE